MSGRSVATGEYSLATVRRAEIATWIADDTEDGGIETGIAQTEIETEATSMTDPASA